eukprot:scaffold173516_cov27-Tisochrysis_lutea.AAC.4
MARCPGRDARALAFEPQAADATTCRAGRAAYTAGRTATWRARGRAAGLGRRKPAGGPASCSWRQPSTSQAAPGASSPAFPCSVPTKQIA